MKFGVIRRVMLVIGSVGFRMWFFAIEFRKTSIGLHVWSCFVDRRGWSAYPETLLPVEYFRADHPSRNPSGPPATVLSSCDMGSNW